MSVPVNCTERTCGACAWVQTLEREDGCPAECGLFGQSLEPTWKRFRGRTNYERLVACIQSDSTADVR